MMGKKQIREALERVRAFDAPVLSVYLDCNPAHAKSPEEIVTRARSTIAGLEDVPRDLGAHVEHLLRTESPRAPVVGLFVESSTMKSEVVPLSTSLPVEDAQTGRGEARFGAPHVAPLLVALDDDACFAVLYADRDRWRLFEATPADIEELESRHRPPAAKELPDRDNARQVVPRYIAERATATDDRLQDAQDEAQKRFYAEAVDRVRALMDERELEQLVVMGPVEGTSRALASLPPPMRERLAGELGGLPNPDASPGQVLAHIAEELGRMRDERKSKLVAQIEERGVEGLDACLDAWQRGRLSAAIVPWDFRNHDVYVEERTRYVATSPDAAHRHEPDARVERKPLEEALVQLADEFDTRLEFVHGELAERVEKNLKGIGGLLRW